MNPHAYDVIVIGGGIVGCALARALASQRRKVVVLEKEADVGLHMSGQNSGVVHSGVDAAPVSLTARLCVEGNHAIRKYAESRNVPFEQVGTYIVATEEDEVPLLDAWKRRGDRNGVPNLEIISIGDARHAEPNIGGYAALFAPTGGIVDSRALTNALAQDAIRLGARFVHWQEVTDIREGTDAAYVSTLDGRYVADIVINCAGAHADRLAHAMGVGKEYLTIPLRGGYCTIMRAGLPIVQSMISSVQSLGSPFGDVQVTRTIDGTVMIGAHSVPAAGRDGYVGVGGRAALVSKLIGHRAGRHALVRSRALRRMVWRAHPQAVTRKPYWHAACKMVQGLQEHEVVVGRRVGIRPQLLRSDGELIEDLVVESTDRSIHVLNMFAPGMTCALPFAKWLTDRMQGSGRGAQFKTPFLASVS